MIHNRFVAVENLEPRMLLSGNPRLPKVVLTQATTVHSQSVTINYRISGAKVTSALGVDIYRSSTDSLSGTHELIGSTTIGTADLTIGKHSVSLIPGTDLTPDTKMEYVIVVANQNDAVAEAKGSTDTVFFRTFMLGALSHGLDISGPTATPAWEVNTAHDLVKDDGYDGAIAFNWVAASRLLSSGEAAAAGDRLFKMVVSTANRLAAAHAGDVVDLNFIGHSRGAVVVSRAMQDLVGTRDRALMGSYITATLLDPHPAGTSTLTLFSAAPTSASIVSLYTTVEEINADPQIVIPSNVSSCQVIFQHSIFSDFPPSAIGEGALNLWGEGPADGIVNQSAAAIQFTALTDQVDQTNIPGPGNAGTGPIGPIGHSEVPLWYEAHIVDAGLA
jgi:hypothetical protein